MNRIAIGTAQFGMNYGIANQSGKVPASEAEKILIYAAERGANTLDTAAAYGMSEKVLGAVGIKGWRVISKIPALPPDIADIKGFVQQKVECSLSDLKITKLHGLLIHHCQDFLGTHGETLYQSLVELKKKGLVEKIGISLYDPDVFFQINKKTYFDIIQVPFNLVDRRILESDFIQTLVKNGTELHVRSVFLQGLLLMTKQQRPQKFSKWNPIWDKFHDWLLTENFSALHACLGFVLSFSSVGKFIVGVDTLDQLSEIYTAIQNGVIKDIPNDLVSHDIQLLNPSNWSTL